jgi:hypothetical protein
MYELREKTAQMATLLVDHNGELHRRKLVGDYFGKIPRDFSATFATYEVSPAKTRTLSRRENPTMITGFLFSLI